MYAMERSFYFMAQCVAILFPFLIEIIGVLAPFLFLKQKVVVYVVVAILLSTFTFWVVDNGVSPSRPVMKRQQIEQRMRDRGKEGPGPREHDAPGKASF